MQLLYALILTNNTSLYFAFCFILKSVLHSSTENFAYHTIIVVLFTACPIELPIKQCLINPCPTRCKRYPLAKC